MTKPTHCKLKWREILKRRELLEACAKGENPRPLAFLFADSPFYTRLAGVPLERTYNEPQAMIKAQLEGWRRILEVVECDVPGIEVRLDFGSFLTASSYGCQVIDQEGSIPGFLPWFETEADLARLESIIPSTTGYGLVAHQFYRQMQEMAEQYPVFYADGEVDYPVRRVRLPAATEGSFTIACMIAGLDRISFWCYDQPDMVKKIVEIITEREIERLRENFRIMGETPSPVGLADDYSPFISVPMYEEFVLPYQQQIRDAFGSSLPFHSCIPDAKLLTAWRDQLRISLFNGFKPRNGLESLRKFYEPVAEVFGNSIVLEPDMDGANVMNADRHQLAEATKEIRDVFAPGKRLKVCATLCGGHQLDDLEKMSAISLTLQGEEIGNCFPGTTTAR